MPLPGYYIAGMGAVAISSQGLDNEVHLPGAAESDERVRNVLGLIGSYQMGAALDAEDLYPTRSTSAPPPEPAG